MCHASLHRHINLSKRHTLISKNINRCCTLPLQPFLFLTVCNFHLCTSQIFEGSLSCDKHPVAASPHHYRRTIAHHNENSGHEHGSTGCHVQSRITSIEHGVDMASP